MAVVVGCSSAAQAAMHRRRHRCLPHNMCAACAGLPGGYAGQACRQRTPVMLSPGMPSGVSSGVSSGASGVSPGVSTTAQQPGQR